MPPAAQSFGKGRPKLLFAALMLGAMSQSTVFSAIGAGLPQMALDLGGHGEFYAQMTMSLAALGLVVGSFCGGWILELAGARGALAGAALLYAVSGGAGLVLRDPAALLAARFAVGFASACMVNTCVWGVAAAYTGARRLRVLGVSAALASYTSLISTVLGGYLTQHGGWPLAFAQYPVYGLLECAAACGGLGPDKPERGQPKAAGQLRLMQLLPFYLVVMVLTAVLYMGTTQFSFLLAEDGFHSPAIRSLIMGARTMFAALVGLCYGSLRRVLGNRLTFIMAVTCMAAALSTLGWGMSSAAAISGAILMGGYAGLLGPYMYESVIERAGTDAGSRAIGLSSGFGYLV